MRAIGVTDAQRRRDRDAFRYRIYVDEPGQLESHFPASQPASQPASLALTP